MATLTEGQHRGEAIFHEGDKNYSREVVTIANGAGVLPAMTVLGQITGSGEYVGVDPAAVDGSEVAAAILLDEVDASAAAQEAVVIIRDAIINLNEVSWPAAADTQGERDQAASELAALNPPILLRA